MQNSVSLSADPDNSFTATTVAKCLGLKRDEVLDFLKEKAIITELF